MRKEASLSPGESRHASGGIPCHPLIIAVSGSFEDVAVSPGRHGGGGLRSQAVVRGFALGQF